ncbi:MAG TPA: 1-deoxy-D-xylulose-5-phosphate reductoisomerase [Burkholderiales bacterium]|nr:1-deoxy-D-xylulose-5-phosphate reductoisomerase [Burkholderiales bacterium]
MTHSRNVAVLGATGSIGRSTLDVIARHPDRFRAFALTAHSRGDELFELCVAHRPALAVLADDAQARVLRSRLAAARLPTEVLAAAPGLIAVVEHPEVDCVMAAIVGAAGLAPTLAAARAGKKLLLANKEALVMAGPIFMAAVRTSGATLLPIDSEHNAIFQCLPERARGGVAGCGVRKIVLTGSGGPFRTRPLAGLAHVTPAEACAHPTWSMGRKISVDSATMMNKALEIIEAHWLFGAPASAIEILVHPQSVVHSMVEYADGSVIAQLGNPDMRTPIAQALAYPDRVDAGVASLDLARLAALTFEAPDFDRFRALALAYDVLAAGGTAPAIFNAANEVAVGAFLAGELAFPRITEVIEATLARIGAGAVGRLEDVVEADARARSAAGVALGRAIVRTA